MVDLRVLPESVGRQTFPSGGILKQMLKPMLRADGAELQGSSQVLKAATHELPVGFSESELARENGAAISAKTELRRLRANKCMGA